MPRKRKPLTVAKLYKLIESIENKNIPIVLVGERQIVIDAEIATQLSLDGDPRATAVALQLIPNG